MRAYLCSSGLKTKPINPYKIGRGIVIAVNLSAIDDVCDTKSFLATYYFGRQKKEVREFAIYKCGE